MKVRKTGYANPYAGISPATPSRDQAASPVERAAPTRRADETTLLGIPPSELTPKVRAAIDRLMAEVQSLRQELEVAKKRIDHLEELADQDALTPVLNRRAFVRELTRLLSFAERYGATTSVLYFDVNGMKEINDTFGHAAGDAALAHVAEVLMAHVRASDVVGRLGGDEFGVILAQADDEEATRKADALVKAIEEQPVVWDGHPLEVRVAYGAHRLSAGQKADDALNAADRAMYAHKRGSTRANPKK